MNKTSPKAASGDDDLAADILTGVAQIAQYGGWNVAATYRMCAKGELPVFRLNAKICARRSKLRRHIERLQAASEAAQAAAE
jgi:hypothetical protein